PRCRARTVRARSPLWFALRSPDAWYAHGHVRRRVSLEVEEGPGSPISGGMAPDHRSRPRAVRERGLLPLPGGRWDLGGARSLAQPGGARGLLRPRSARAGGLCQDEGGDRGALRRDGAGGDGRSLGSLPRVGLLAEDAQLAEIVVGRQGLEPWT